MSIVLYHHPFSRAAGVVWQLEELGQPYELHFVDIMKGEHKKPELVAMNGMGKLPVLKDGDAVVSESAAIGLYLADKYSLGNLAPKLDDPARGQYLRWSFFAPSVIEPALMCRQNKWEFREQQAGWGNYDAMIATMEKAITGHDWLLGNRFTMADVIFGGNVRFMTMFKMLEPKPAFAAYIERLNARPALQRADAKNKEIMDKHGIKMPGT
jgi:glutathione S-transferase